MKPLTTTAYAVVLAWGFALVARADVPVPRLFDDPAAMPGFAGTASCNSKDLFMVELDYAVFAPGDYAGTDPSKATEYVYAYQAVLPSTGSRGLSTVSISLVEEGLATATGWESEAVTGGIEPIFSLVTGPAAAVDTYFVPQVVPNGYSTVFFYTSPSGPTFAPASVLGGGYSDQQMAPSPAPEPSTAVGLLSMAGAGLVAYAWRKRRSSRSCF